MYRYNNSNNTVVRVLEKRKPTEDLYQTSIDFDNPVDVHST